MRGAIRKFLETLTLMWGRVRYHQWRNPKYTATVQVMPGRTTLILMNGKQTAGVVVLNSLTHDLYAGVTAEFISLSNFLDAREMRVDPTFEDLMKIATATQEGATRGQEEEGQEG